MIGYLYDLNKCDYWCIVLDFLNIGGTIQHFLTHHPPIFQFSSFVDELRQIKFDIFYTKITKKKKQNILLK